jgi:phosphatidylethanolamine-binding protein (PEBP) family uncharacterized protein
MLRSASSPQARPSWPARAGTLLVAVLLYGCGGSSPSHTNRAGGSETATAHKTDAAPERPDFALLSGQRREPPPFEVTSPARGPSGVVETRYTCRGADMSPAVRWGNLPQGTEEIVVFVDTLGIGRPMVNWAVAGVRPRSRGIAAGKVPTGAIVGRNSIGRIGYYLCPRQGAIPPFVSIVVVALPRKLAVRRGFDANTLLRETTKPGAHHGSVLMVARKPTASRTNGGAQR